MLTPLQARNDIKQGNVVELDGARTKNQTYYSGPFIVQTVRLPDDGEFKAGGLFVLEGMYPGGVGDTKVPLVIDIGTRIALYS